MNMLLGEKLKKARKNIGMSQNEVAEELMLSRQTISNGKIMYACRIWKIFKEYVSYTKLILIQY